MKLISENSPNSTHTNQPDNAFIADEFQVVPNLPLMQLPKKMIWGVIAICSLPFLLNLFGVSFSATQPIIELSKFDNLSSEQLLDTLHQTLTGSFIHTILEWSAFCAAIFTAILSFLHFAIKRDVVTPIIGVALFFAGCMDAFHTLAADRLLETVADNQQLIPLSWAICRLFSALILITGTSLFLNRQPSQQNLSFIFITSFIFGLVAYIIIRVLATSPHLPDTYFPNSPITRPWDLIPLLLFLYAGFYIFPRFYQQQPSLLSHSLIISTIPQVATQLHMTFGSTALFDNHFNIAHFLKIVAYLVPLTGLLLDYIRTYHRQATTLTRLQKTQKILTEQAQQLAKKNQQLEDTNHQIETAYQERDQFFTLSIDMLGIAGFDGYFKRINPAFERILGFKIDELIAEPFIHFVHPEDQESTLAVSKNLSLGNSVVAFENRYRCKDGTYKWLLWTSASILEQQAIYFTARDITEQKIAQEQLEKIAAERQAEAHLLTQQVLKLLEEIKTAAKGDLTVKAQVTNDVLGSVADSCNFLISSLRRVVNEIKQVAQQVKKATSESIHNNGELAQQAQQQALQIEAVIAEIHKIVRSIYEIREVTTQAEKVAEKSALTAQNGGISVDRTVAGIQGLRQTISQTSKMMKRLAESSQQISKIVTSISQIASQTNLLALNATIEAARAGEQGLGFAVVADEIRKLAERSSGATEEISEIVATIQEETNRVMVAMDAGTQEVVEGTQLAVDTKNHLNAIIEVSREMNDLIQSITQVSQQQSVSAEAISSRVEQVRAIAGSTAHQAEDVTLSLNDLANIVERLQQSVQNFRT
jgi:PAS domain S-box-containing protein